MLSKRTLAAGRFISLHAIDWMNAAGQQRVWEMASRVGEVKAVMLIARLCPSGRLVLIRQYRPPAGGMVIEFPAGLVGAGESPEETAVRELREETGYHGRVIAVLPAALNTPGLSDEAAHPVLMEIDERERRNHTPHSEPDEDEQIEVVLVEAAAARRFLEEEASAGALFDTKVVAWLWGFGAGANAKQP